MTNEKRRPTERMQNALRRFGVAGSEIDSMSFDEASQKLDELISKARAKKREREPAKPEDQVDPPSNPDEQVNQEDEARGVSADLGLIGMKVRERLHLAKEIMKQEFKLSENQVSPDGVVLAEITKQLGSEEMILEVASQKRQNIRLAREAF